VGDYLLNASVTLPFEPTTSRDADLMDYFSALTIDARRNHQNSKFREHSTLLEWALIKVARTTIDVMKSGGDLPRATNSLVADLYLVSIFANQNV
jgi:hypothetical protein